MAVNLVGMRLVLRREVSGAFLNKSAVAKPRQGQKRQVAETTDIFALLYSLIRLGIKIENIKNFP